MESKDIVRRTIEEDGEFLVSFRTHDGYFRVPDSANAADLKRRILKAERDQEEVSFAFDRELNILKISDSGAKQ
jgi:hypothetical protein